MPPRTKPTDPTTDARHPDTTATDPTLTRTESGEPGPVGTPVTDASNTTDDLGTHDPAQASLYGFRSIDDSQAKSILGAGPGRVEPERHEAVNAEGTSTFASRRAAREGQTDTRVAPDKITTK